MERIGVPPGTEIGGYHVLSPLGHGGMGAVYRAVDGAGTTVALKLLHPHLGADPDARERLRREVANLQRVRHPGVARVLDAEIDSAEAFIVTELVDGEDLTSRVRAEGPLAPSDLADLAEQLRSALVVVHAAGVLHRDITPGNVLVTDRGAVLIDFGIAQAADDSRVTSTGLVVGTPGYLSPELLEGGEPSAAGDWWGWAALLGFAATGRPPFGVRPLQAVLGRVLAGDADLEGLDRRTASALRQALALDPWRRGRPEQLVEELRLAADDAAGRAGEVPGGVGATALTQAYQEPVAGSGGPGPYAQVPAYGQVPGLPAGAGYGAGDETGYDEAGYDQAGYDEAGYDEAGYDEAGYDEAGYDEEEDGAELEAGYTPPEPRRRIGSVAALGAAFVAAGAVRPFVTLAVALVVAALCRAVGIGVEAVGRRRARRGERRGDPARTVAAAPWYLLRGALGAGAAAILAVCVLVLVGGVAWWLLDTGHWLVAPPAPGQRPGELGGNAAWVTAAVLAALTAVGLLMLWFGPMSDTTRVGARWVLGVVAPGWAGAAVVVVVGLVAAWLLVALVGSTQDTVWWPLPGAPDLD
jgi:predicted Ser/Thr protein kinase